MEPGKRSRVSVCLGSVFPRDCETRQEDVGMGSCYPIYLRLLEMFREKKIDSEDFKSIRRALAGIPIDDFSTYADLVFAFLSFEERSTILERVCFYDQKYQCHLLEKREKRIERDPKTNQMIREIIECVERPPEFGDVVRVAKAIVSKMAAYPRDLIEPEFLPMGTQDIFCVARYNYEKSFSLLEDASLFQPLMEKIYQWFDVTFEEFGTNPALKQFYAERRNTLEGKVLGYIYKKRENALMWMEREVTEAHNQHLFETHLESLKAKRRAGRKLGGWSD